MLKEYQDQYSGTSLTILKPDSKRNKELIDEAWDLFSERIGELKLNTPISVEQFDNLFVYINKSGRFNTLKSEILKSFMYDSYLWPLVKK